jgi:hypothetical protein
MSFAAVAAIVAMVPSATVVGQNAGERFSGFAINMNSGPRTARVEFNIERWSTDAEKAQLLAIVRDNKDPNPKLLDAVQRLPKVGWIHAESKLAWDLRYAYQIPLDEGGRQIVLGTDRPISFVEARNNPRTMDYPFTIIEMHLDKGDEGQGKIQYASRLYIDKKNNLVIENYGQQSVRFNEIKRVK